MIFKHHDLSIPKKIRIMQTLIFPMMLYGNSVENMDIKNSLGSILKLLNFAIKEDS